MALRYSILSMALAILTACNQDQAANSTDLSVIQTLRIDSCSIALAVDSQTANDQNLYRYQNAIKNGIQPLVNLEKLGWAYISAARSSYDDGYYHLALETAKCIDSKHSNHSASLMLQAYVAHQLHQFKLAETLAAQLVEARGYWFDYGLLGDALMEQGRLEDAQQAYQTMMNQRPGPQAYSRAAHLRWIKGDLDGAIEMAKLAVHSYGYGRSETASWAKIKLAEYLLLNGNTANTSALIDQTLDLNPDYAPALYLKGRLLLVSGQDGEAISLLKAAIELNPLPEYLWLLFESLDEAGFHAQAEEVKKQFTKAARIEDPRTYAIYLAGSPDYSPDKKSLPLKLAKQELEQRQDIFSHDAMAWALYANNKTEQALVHIEQALAESTHDVRLYYHAALIYSANGKTDRALAWFEKARKNQHLLLPSERKDLLNRFAQFNSKNARHDRNNYLSGDNHELKGDQYESTI